MNTVSTKSHLQPIVLNQLLRLHDEVHSLSDGRVHDVYFCHHGQAVFVEVKIQD